jgi:hypothetical protein
MTTIFHRHWRDVQESAWRWRNFSPAEIACRGTGKLLINPAALDKLQALRIRLSKPLIIRSAYRSPEHNRAVGGAKASKHIDGTAFDIAMSNHDPVKFAEAARAVGFLGFGTYRQAGKVEALFRQFDGHLARQGYIARGGQILDASIVPVPRNHNTRDENAAIKRGEVPEDWADEPAKRVQKDLDARWTKKHGRSHYGYKNHVNVDRMHKLIRRYHVSDAALHPSCLMKGVAPV